MCAEWKIFKRAIVREKKNLIEKTTKKLSKPPSLQELMKEMESSGGYAALFPEMFKLIKILLALPVGTATVERSFSQMKLIKSRLRSRISDINLGQTQKKIEEPAQLYQKTGPLYCSLACQCKDE